MEMLRQVGMGRGWKGGKWDRGFIVREQKDLRNIFFFCYLVTCSSLYTMFVQLYIHREIDQKG